MAANTGKLTATAIKHAKVGKSTDGGGLYLDVRDNGSRYWRMKFRHTGRERLLSFGVCPEVSLSEARQRRNDARGTLRAGDDPAALKRARKAADKLGAADSFSAIADEWLSKQSAGLAAVTLVKARWMVTLVPTLHASPIARITASEVLAALRYVESTGKLETAHRVKRRLTKCSATPSLPDGASATQLPTCVEHWPPCSRDRTLP